MSSNITNISHGQTNWDTVVNQNFQNLDADSGWVAVPVYAPFTGDVWFRKSAHSLEITGIIYRSEEITTSDGTKIADIPANVFPKGTKGVGIVSYQGGALGYARLMINIDGSIVYFDSTQATLSSPIRFNKSITI